MASGVVVNRLQGGKEGRGRQMGRDPHLARHHQALLDRKCKLRAGASAHQVSD